MKSYRIFLFLILTTIAVSILSCRKKFDIKKSGNSVNFKIICSAPSSSDDYTVGYTSESNTIKFEDITFPGDSIRTFSTTLSKKDHYYFSVIPKQNKTFKMEIFVNEKLYNALDVDRPTPGHSYELSGKLKSY